MFVRGHSKWNWISAEHYRTTGPLAFHRDGSAKMIYTVMSAENSDTVQVEDGILMSGSNSGQAALQVTAQEEFGINQTLILLVKVMFN